MLRAVALVGVRVEELLAIEVDYSEWRWSGTKVGDVSARVMAG